MKNDNKERLNGWLPEHDEELTEMVLEEVRNGGFVKDAVTRYSHKAGRSIEAVKFRWSTVLSKHFKEEYQLAKQESRYKTGKARSIRVDKYVKKEPVIEVKESVQTPMPTIEEPKEVLLKWEKLLLEREAKFEQKEEQKEEQKDPITPAHYHKGGIDVIGFLESHFGTNEGYSVSEGFYIGNIIKYVSRYKQKNGKEDLQKAEYYLNKLKQQGE